MTLFISLPLIMLNSLETTKMVIENNHNNFPGIEEFKQSLEQLLEMNNADSGKDCGTGTCS